MHAAEWLEASRAGAIVHDWTELELRDGDNVARVKVSADSARVRLPGGDRIREGAGGYAADTIMQTLRAHLLTAKLIEQRHFAGTVILEPILAPWIEPGGSTANTTPAEASKAIDKAIQRSQPFTAWGDAPAQGKAGDWLVVGTGKPFCIDERCTEDWGVNHGWIVHESQVQWLQAVVVDGVVKRKAGHYWTRAGVHVTPAVSLPGFYVIQNRGRAHTIGATAKDQDDYASPALGIFELCWLNGQADVLTSKLFTEREVCGLVTHDGRPLVSARHPGVQLVVEFAPPEELAPDTDPSPTSSVELEPWLEPELTHAERKIAWCEAHLGMAERPNGSNNSPAIRPLLEACVRDNTPGFGAWLGKAGGNWCAAWGSGADRCSHLVELDAARVHKDRASGYEIENDAKKVKRWRAVELVLRGEFVPEPGDGVLFPRGEPGSWKRHYAILERYDAATKTLHTFDGNKGNTSGRHTAPLRRALGFVELHDARYSDEEIDDMLAGVVDDELIPMPELVVKADPPDTDGDNLLEQAWSKMDPSPWAPQTYRGVKGKSRRWCVQPSGIYVQGEEGPRRTKGKPVTATKMLERYGVHVEAAADFTGVSPRMILAMLMTEGGLLPVEKLERYEKHLNDYSFGIAQTLTSTAHAMALRLDMQQPARPVPRGGDADEWREFLFEPSNSITIGASYLDYNDERFGLLECPVLSYAAYNAGSPRPSSSTLWGVHAYTYDADKDGVPEYDALDTFAAWYGDACAVLL